MRYALPLCFGIVVFLSGCQKAPPDIVVKRVIDGDTLLVTAPDGSEKRLELAYIDAPEREQPFGREARDFVSNKLLNQPILVDLDGSAQEVLIGGKSLNLEMVELGLAWVSPKIGNAVVGESYLDAQTQAINKMSGFWSAEHELRVPPWQWRKQATERSPNKNYLRVQPKPKAPTYSNQRPPSEPKKEPNEQTP